jgi:hypothetical protein
MANLYEIVPSFVIARMLTFAASIQNCVLGPEAINAGAVPEGGPDVRALLGR